MATKKAVKLVSKPKSVKVDTEHVRQAQDVAVEKRKAELVDLIRVGMPSVSEMKQNSLGVLRKHRDWEARVGCLVVEYESLNGKPGGIEALRPV